MKSHCLAVLMASAFAVAGAALARTQDGKSAKSAPETAAKPDAKPSAPEDAKAEKKKSDRPRKVIKTDEEWAKILTEPQFMVTRRKDTEIAFSGEYVNNHARGIYHCVCCGEDLFSSATKFDSGTGWPSFYAPMDRKSIAQQFDYSGGQTRVEVNCSVCGAHLGHVFDDGPAPTGLRFCINSLSLKFTPVKGAAAKTAAKKTKGSAKTAKKPAKSAAKSTSKAAPAAKADAPAVKDDDPAGASAPKAGSKPQSDD